jgi:SWI/SNF-related matrix-associated actin-dependent regulator of chromatin subfamily A-like protein 1
MSIIFAGGVFAIDAADVSSSKLTMKGWKKTTVAGDTRWVTSDIAKVAPFFAYCVGEARKKIQAFNEKQRAEIADSVAVTSAIQIPLPEWKDLRAFQKAGVAFALGRANTLIADAPRLGKSCTSIAVSNVIRPKSVLIVCPAAVKPHWQREWAAWNVHPELTTGIAQGPVYPKTPVVIINYDIVEKHKTKLMRGFDLVIFDESHYLKNATAKRTKTLLGTGSIKFPGVPYKRRLFLSATPAPTRPSDLWTTLRACDPKGLGKNQHNFWHRYCNAFTGPWGLDTSGSSNEEELQRLMRKSFMVRRERADVMPDDFPPARQTITLPKEGLEPLLAQELEGMESSLMAFEAMVGGVELGHTQMDASTAPHQALSLASVGMITDFVKGLLETENKVVVFAHHRAVVEAYVKALTEFGVVSLYGGASPKDRQAAIDTFREDPDVRVFVGNIKSAGAGISLAAANVIVFAELTYVPGDIRQAESRIYLMGKKDQGTIFFPVVQGSFSEVLAKLLVKRQDSFDRTFLAARLTEHFNQLKCQKT